MTVEPDLWSLTLAERDWVMTKSRANRLGCALLFLFFREHGRFPRTASEFDPEAVSVLSSTLEVCDDLASELDDWFSARTLKRLRVEIRQYFGFREATVADAQALTLWLRDHSAPTADGDLACIVAHLESRCRELVIETPTLERMERIARAALHEYEEVFTHSTYQRLFPETCERLDALLLPELEAAETGENEELGRNAPALLQKLRSYPGRPSLASVQEELAKRDLIRHIALPPDLFIGRSNRELERYRRRVAVEAPPNSGGTPKSLDWRG